MVDIVIKHDVLTVHPPTQEVLNSVLSTFDAAFPTGMTDLYCRLTTFAHTDDVPMRLPSKSDPQMKKSRQEVEAIVHAMMVPADHLAASYTLEFGHLLAIRPHEYAEAWKLAEHTMQETIAEVHRLRRVRTLLSHPPALLGVGAT